MLEASNPVLVKSPRLDSSVNFSTQMEEEEEEEEEDPNSFRRSPSSGASCDQSPPNYSHNDKSGLSPWICHIPAGPADGGGYNRLMGSLVREQGHVYSLAVSEDLLYTGSDSKNIRVWRKQREFSGFKSSSGLVKSIVITGGASWIFTGHQDGKIRVWKKSGKNPAVHKQIGTLPTFKAFIKSSMKPSNYVEVRKRRNTPWIRHFDAISSLSLSEDHALLYSASWDRTVKVWKVATFKCLESITVHEDAVNAVVSGFDGLLFTGSADGTVKVWRREMQGKGTKHFFSQTLLKQECAVTALALDPPATTVYCGSSDGVVHFWERSKLSTAGGQLRGHGLAVLCLSTAGSLVLSGSADMNICVWKRMICGSHVFLSTLAAHNGPVKCLAVERDRDFPPAECRWILYSGSLDKSVKMWRISEHIHPDQMPDVEDPKLFF